MPTNPSRISRSRRDPDRSRRAFSILGVLACVLLGHSIGLQPARAQTADRVLVIPLESTVPDAQADTVLAFNLALAHLIEQDASTRVTVAQTSLEDTMAIVGCSERSAACLTRVAEALEVDYIVFGSAAPGDTPDRFELTLVVARRRGEEPPIEHRFTVQAAKAEAAEGAFTEAAPAGFLRATTATEPEQPAATAAAAPGSAGAPGYAFDVDRVEQSSWVVMGTGGAILGAGVMFWVLASSSQSAVNDLAVDTAADFDRLVELEDRTRNRAITGNVLAITGALIGVAGAVLAVQQGLVREEPAGVTITPTATSDSVGITLSIGWPR